MVQSKYIFDRQNKNNNPHFFQKALRSDVGQTTGHFR
jgi:hypothetical protein